MRLPDGLTTQLSRLAAGRQDACRLAADHFDLDPYEPMWRLGRGRARLARRSRSQRGVLDSMRRQSVRCAAPQFPTPIATNAVAIQQFNHREESCHHLAPLLSLPSRCSEIQPDGAKKLSIAALKDGIFTRGVLVDIAWLRQVPYLENNVVIYPSDLDA
jgi:hypothetical protein